MSKIRAELELTPEGAVALLVEGREFLASCSARIQAPGDNAARAYTVLRALLHTIEQATREHGRRAFDAESSVRANLETVREARGFRG